MRLGAVVPVWRAKRLADRVAGLVPTRARRLRAIDERDNRYTRQILSYVLREDSNTVDVGSHEGSVLRDIVRLAPRGRHFAFEPLPRLASRLSAEFPSMRVFDLALSDTEGRAQFVHVLGHPACSGLRRRTLPVEGEETETIEVRTARLDDLLPPDLPIDFVKIDVEGAELEVLRGAERTIRRYRPHIVLEHGKGAADHYGTTPAMVHDFMAAARLRIFGIDGSGPLDRSGFAALFESGALWNFLARA